MKIFKFLAMLTISVLFFTGCEDEEITNYAFQEISAPTDVSAVFDVSQDDTGTVTITPSGEGAQVFQIDLGNGETAELAAGESITTVYPEGEFMVNIVAVGSTGLTSEYNQMLNISFKAPENLAIVVDQPDANPQTITVSATADNATLFQVFFGDVDDEEPTQLMPGESIQHTYEPGVYELTVIAIGAGAATAEEDEIIIVPEATDPLKLPVTFDDPLVGYNIVPFGAADTSFEIITNPDLSGANDTESMVGAITKTGAQFEGITFNLSEAVDLSTDKILSLKVWSDVAYPVLLKLETGVNDERSNEVLANHGGTGWETLTFNFATDAKTSYQSDSDPGGDAIVPDGQYDGISLFLDFAGSAAGTFYVDDLMQESAAPACDAETEENIDPANGPLVWTFKTDDEAFAFEPFGDIGSGIVSNPKTDGINSSCNVQIVDKSPGCATWSGVGKPLATAMDFTTTDKKIFKLKVLAETQTAEVTLRLEREPFPDVDPAEDRVAQITEVGVWQELTFDFSDVDDKTFRSVILYFERDAECDGDVYYFDDLIQTDGTGTGSSSLGLPLDFDGSQDYVGAASGVDFDVVINPEQSGINDSATMVGEMTNAGSDFEALTITLDNAMDFSGNNKTIKMKVYSEIAYPVLFKLETGVNGERANEVEVNHGGTGWEELTFDFNNARKSFIDGNQGVGEPFVPTGQYATFSIFLDFAGSTAGTFYIDDIIQTNGTGGSSSNLGLPLDFDGSEDYAGAASGVDFAVVVNPEQSGINDSATMVGELTNAGSDFEALTISLDNAMDFSGSNKTITMKVYSEIAYPVLFKLETGVNGERANEVEVNHDGNGWQELTFDFNNARKSFIDGNQGVGEPFVPTGQYATFSIFLDFAGSTAGTFYIDDIAQN